MLGAGARGTGVAGGAAEARRSTPAHISAALCLRGGKTYVPCSKCADVCPVEAITLTGRSANIAESCLACGICSATCPTGAIDVAGFGDPPDVGARLHVECARVPTQRLESESWVVPCIAGLRISDVVAAAEKQGDVDASVIFVDRGLCASCPVSRGTNIIARAHAALSFLIERTGSEAVRLDRAERPIQPAEAQPAGWRPPSSRRAFLRSLVAPPRKERRPSGTFEDRATIARLATTAERTVDASFYPSIAISQACRDHGVCTASCPTGALRRENSGESDEIRRIVFDPAQCLACGRCADVCPEHALTFAAAGAAQMQYEPAVLRETRLSVCQKCEEAYVADDGGADFCLACRKSQSLFIDLLAANRKTIGVPKPDISDGTV